MGQRERVQASLMAGDSRDGVARRKVADQVRQASENGAAAVAGRPSGSGWALEGIREAGKAASAVVLASDLRAPLNGHAYEAPKVSENRQGQRARLVHVEFMLRTAEKWLDPEQPGYWVERGRGCVADALAEVRAMIDGDG
jgi:hypothetical protein